MAAPRDQQGAAAQSQHRSERQEGARLPSDQTEIVLHDQNTPRTQDELMRGTNQQTVFTYSSATNIGEQSSKTAVGEQSDYYEPQGELLNKIPDPSITATEFNIPNVMSDAGVSWSPSNPFQSFFGGSNNSSASQPLSVAGVKRKAPADQQDETPANKISAKRPPLRMATASDESLSQKSARPYAQNANDQNGSSARRRSATEAASARPINPSSQSEATRPEARGQNGTRRTLTDPSTPMILPARKVFPIQIGDKLFGLSGASISSDAPSYFSQFFEEQLQYNVGADSVRTLYIDRDPATFEDISLHLQGYHIEPRDGTHFVRLYADAQFFSLPRLTAQLFASTIFIRIGDCDFQIPRDLFSGPGDSPNYFSLGIAVFFTTPQDAFPGLQQRSLLRPPSVLPPNVPNRSSKTFADLMHVLKGYPLEVKSEEHRRELLRDARYYHLKGLEQRLIPHQISYNLARRQPEILVRLDDIRQSGVSYVADNTGPQSSEPSPESSSSSVPTAPGWIHYRRPYVDSEAYVLIVEINSDESMQLSIASGPAGSPARMGRATFFRQTLARITSLFSVVASKMSIPITQPLGFMMVERNPGAAGSPVSPSDTGVSDERVKVRIGSDADVTIDGKRWQVDRGKAESGDESGSEAETPDSASGPPGRKRRKVDRKSRDDGEELVVTKSQWRLRVQPMSSGTRPGQSGMEVVLGAVKIDAYRSERARNARRGFLS